MLNFLIFLVYLACLAPFVIVLVRKWMEKKDPKWFLPASIAFLVGSYLILSVGLYAFRPYIESVWFKSLGYDAVFWKAYWIKIAFFCGSFAAVLLVSLANIGIVQKLVGAYKEEPKRPFNEREESWRRTNREAEEEEESKERRKERQTMNFSIFLVFLAAGLITAIIYGFVAAGFWDRFLLWGNQTAMGINDPIFNKDLGFYMFSLPFLNFIAACLFWFLVVILCETIIIYAIYYSQVENSRDKEHIQSVLRKWRVHSVVLAIGVFGVFIWMRFLGFYNLLFVSKDGFFGAGNTEIHAMIPANWIFMATIAAVIVILIVWLFAKKNKLLYLMTLIPAVWLLVVAIYPGLFQHLIVDPSKFNKEQQYISYNIEFTRQAFGLDKIEEREPSVSENLTASQIAENRLTLDNIRIWDWRALNASYQQQQIFRQYYHFADIDIDRYTIDGQYRQVMLSARELDQARLNKDAQNWINQHLVYTHGYGIALSPVNEVTQVGGPVFLVKDIPTVSSVPEIKITRPEIYFGELTKAYALVNTSEKEFDYPKGDENVYATYQGTGGIEIETGLKRLAFATKFGGMNLLLSNNLMPDSRILYYRQINERLNKLAPFLLYDKDYYIVADSQGKLWGMRDAYTFSKMYPYSTPYAGVPFKQEMNYIRNSVKVVIDPYNGDVSFYVFDNNDPVLQTWQKIFPQLFKPKEEMPKDLLAHVRYPEDFLYTQAQVYCTYHMTDFKTFFTKEDVWQIGKELYGPVPQEIIPYYVIIKLPGGQAEEEFIQMLPFTPQNRDNLIGWFAGRSDAPNYGKALSFKFSKQTLIYGPMQFTAKANENEEIAMTTALWAQQQGSDIIRGNTLIIPIADSLLYVEPIYLKSKEAEMPEIKKVIVSIGEKVDWGDTLDEALAKITSVVHTAKPCVMTQTGTVQIGEDILAVLQSADQHFANYQRLTGEGKLAEAGAELTKLQDDLERLYELTGQK